MGYYAYVQVPDKAVRERVYRFFRDHHLWRQDMPAPRPGRDVCAYGKKDDVGFYYQGGRSDRERTFVHGLLRWLTLKVGPTTLFRDEPVPYYFYEHTQVLLVRAAKYPDITDWHAVDVTVEGICEVVGVDEFGVAPSTGVTLEEANTWDDASPYKAMAILAHLTDAMLRVELARLDALWETYP